MATITNLTADDLKKIQLLEQLSQRNQQKVVDYITALIAKQKQQHKQLVGSNK